MNDTRRPYAVRGDRITSSYLGYPLLISNTSVLVSSPSGRRLGRVATVKSARLFVRSYRRLERASLGVRVVSDLAERALPDDWVKETG